MTKYQEIEERIKKLDYPKFKMELLKNINTNGKILKIASQLDIDNQNGDKLDINKLVDIILNDKTIEISEKGIYGIYIKPDAYSFLIATLSILKNKNAAIICTTLYNYISINFIYALVHDILKQEKLDGIINLQNNKKENFFQTLDNSYIKLDLEEDKC